jgi:hypothetical protein
LTSLSVFLDISVSVKALTLGPEGENRPLQAFELDEIQLLELYRSQHR